MARAKQKKKIAAEDSTNYLEEVDHLNHVNTEATSRVFTAPTGSPLNFVYAVQSLRVQGGLTDCF